MLCREGLEDRNWLTHINIMISMYYVCIIKIYCLYRLFNKYEYMNISLIINNLIVEVGIRGKSQLSEFPWILLRTGTVEFIYLLIYIEAMYRLHLGTEWADIFSDFMFIDLFIYYIYI